MKKNEIFEGTVERLDFPNRGILNIDGEPVMVKHVLPGQKIRAAAGKRRKGKCEGYFLEVLEPSPMETEKDYCRHFGICGGCSFQSVSYEGQLKLKEAMVKRLIGVFCPDEVFEGIKGSPLHFGYRNKMEYSFGDAVKGGPLMLGMHKRGSFHDIVTVEDCRIADGDFQKILLGTLELCRKEGLSFYQKMKHTGYLRHLLIRKAWKTGELLVVLVTSGQTEGMNHEGTFLTEFAGMVKGLPLEGRLAGILHMRNDGQADVVRSDETTVLYGQEYFYEELLGLRFKITPFSFFQTNTSGAEVLYRTVRDYIGETKDSLIYDLYSGTGTIAQVVAPVAKKVIGVEIVEEAVAAARENAIFNGLSNCRFLAGDVLKTLDTIEEKPDLIILDPPRDGIHPKALPKILAYGVERIIYISCKPTSLARDLNVFAEAGYEVKRACAVDMFPGTSNIETVCLLSKKP
ncbi:MAG: 23S rRNA (uracil(1939)-C(5))-methyltransferase RlmD [Lachnospiraceae bacterium]|nr:23S rRNA (uracil(1939)-C(5))-methyltransferase RlmD [Lachnospiraceae bacterium]